MSTKNDPHPIENVIVSNDLAMESEKKFNLQIQNTKEAFKGLKFNISKEGNVLYTANENHTELVEYKFGDEYVSEYKPYKNYVQMATKDEVEEIVNRVNMTNELLKGEEFSNIASIEVKDTTKAIYGHGWVVYMDSNNKIRKLIIDKFKEDKKLRDLIEINKEKYFGGVTYEQGVR